MGRHSAPPRRRRPRLGRWVPFVCVLAAIAAVTASGIDWVTSPFWGHQVIAGPAPARNVGVIPVSPWSGTVLAKPVALVLSPNRIEIPALKTEAPILAVGDDNRELNIPLDPKVAGWWKGGAEPGAATGTAIIAGHINYAGVQGALGRIGELNPGDTVYIYGVGRDKKQGRLRLKITGVRTYSKKALPFAEIFDQSSVGRVAIVTCGGPFDASTGNYLDNIVAFAVPV